MIALPSELKQALENAGEIPLRLEDPETHRTYVLLDGAVYEQVRALVEPDSEDELDNLVHQMYPLIAELDPEDWEDASQYDR